MREKEEVEVGGIGGSKRERAGSKSMQKAEGE